MCEWQTIDTVPKDGRYVMLWPHYVTRRGKRCTVPAAGFWHTTHWGASMWASPLRGAPTHWAPIEGPGV
jgi:hypothetical protein